MSKICVGCGSKLQTISKTLEGYVSESVYSKADLCERCFKIKHYGVNDVIDKNHDFNLIVKKIEKENTPSVFLIDVLTMSEYDKKILKCIKNCKYVLLTKKDLLPKSVREKKLIKYFETHYGKYKTMCISSKKKYNIDAFLKMLKKDNVKKLYVLGLTNSGKSTFINTLMESVGNKSNITTSSIPNTTLELLNIKINDDLTVIDTPGFINENSIYNFLTPKEVKKVMPIKEIKPKIYNMKENYSVFVENILRIDYLSSKPSNFVFYINNNLSFRKMKSTTRDDLKVLSKKNLHINKDTDIVIEGLGFIKVVSEADIVIYTLDEKMITLRDKLI